MQHVAIDEIEGTKTCSKCRKTKPLSEFDKTEIGRFGVYSSCKACRHLRSVVIYADMKENDQPRLDAIMERLRAARRAKPHWSWAKASHRFHRLENYEIKFTKEELCELAQRSPNCAICGMSLKWEVLRGLAVNSPTLDRIDNGTILTLENVQIVCRRCNTTKQNRTMAEFVDYCRKVVEKFGVP